MNTNKMKLSSRIIVAVASLCLIATFFFPVWFIFLVAPQYPEGLTLNIWLNKITGQVDIINGLNHYIGMKHIKEEMFPEFKFMIYIVAFFILLGLIVALTGKRKLLFSYLLLTIIGGGLVIYDFYQWGYDYGHNLDPKAAIQIPGLSYQPPLFGHKRLLNFDAYSYPDIGGWIVVGVGICFFLVWFYEWYKNRKRKTTPVNIRMKSIPAIAILMIFFLSSCNTEPEQINIGKDPCADCTMTIMDLKFGGEIITKKGKIYKFDDAHCLSHFINSGKVKKEEIARTLFIDFENNQHFLDAESSFFVVSPQLKSPMNGNTVAFSNAEIAKIKAAETGGEMKAWNDLTEVVKSEHLH